MALDWTTGAKGAAGGALTGAQLGSVIPGVGTAIGAGAGALFGGLGGLFSSPNKGSKLSSLDERQQRLNELQHEAIFGQGPLADLYGFDPMKANASFDRNIADPAYRSFQENLVPSITGQFRSKGLMNSSYAGDALSRLARDVQESLNTQRANYIYGGEQQSQANRQNAVNSLQDRSTFAYNKSSPSTGFDIDSILKSFTPEMIDQVKEIFNK